MAFAIEFFLRRIIQGVFIVFVVAFIIFALLRIVPGDPMRIILGPMAPASALEETAQALGLRDPIPVQYLRFVGDVLQGDFGRSYIRGLQGGSMGGSQDQAGFDPSSRAPVLELIMNALPYSALLAGMGVLLALLVSIPVGIAAGLYSGRWPDRLALYLSSFLVSLPNIWVGIVLIFLISVKAEWLPAIGYRGLAYAVIPAMVIAIELSPVLIRAISVSVANNLRASFFEVGLVRGLSRGRMVRGHVLRNAAVPLFNLFGAQLIGMLLGGLFVVEYIFSFPGVGLLTINAVFQRDFPVIQAVAMLAASALVVVNMLVDFASTLIDRRLNF
jgi:ABC-type dipeptide/oligopeptide/nickel transport system permease component